MKAVVCRELGDLSVLRLEDIPLLEPGEGEVKIRVRACGINFADALMVAGKYQRKISPPFVPGFEVAGEIIELGNGVEDLTCGMQVMGMAESGGYAEEAIMRASALTPLPAGLDHTLAASFAVTYGTSYMALTHRARLGSGEVLLVHGAAGGTGLSAVEIGKALGATVIATAGGPDKLAVAKAAGADQLIDYRAEDIRARVKEMTGGAGADVIFDPVGGKVFDASLRCVAFEGRILIIGFAGGDIQQIPANHVMVKNVDIIGFNRGAYDERKPALARECQATLVRWLAEGTIKPLVSRTCPLEEAVDALDAVVNRKTVGKVVITP